MKLIPVILFLLLAPVMGASASEKAVEPTIEIVQEEVVKDTVAPVESIETEETKKIPPVEETEEIETGNPPSEEEKVLEKEETVEESPVKDIPIENETQNIQSVSDNSIPYVLQTEVETVTPTVTDIQGNTDILIDIYNGISVTNFLLSFIFGLFISFVIMYRFK